MRHKFWSCVAPFVTSLCPSRPSLRVLCEPMTVKSEGSQRTRREGHEGHNEDEASSKSVQSA